MGKRHPKILYWFWKEDTLQNRQYRKDLAFIRENTDFDLLFLTERDGLSFFDFARLHEPLRDAVDYAHSLGLKIGLQLWPIPRGCAGFDRIGDESKAQGLALDGEVLANDQGEAYYTSTARWGREAQFCVLRHELLRVYSVKKTTADTYEPGSLADVTDRTAVLAQSPESISLHIRGGREHARRTYFIMTVQYYNYPELFSDYHIEEFKRALDAYADIPFDGTALDEYGYLKLAFRPNVQGFPEGSLRGRLYSADQEAYFRDKLGLDLPRLLLDMRLSPAGDSATRVKAINIYCKELRKPPLRIENWFYDHSKKLFGAHCFAGVHNTFHNELDNDEMWTTACNWWDLPREYGQTDEGICNPVRLGVMISAKEPVMYDMYFSHDPEQFLIKACEGAPLGCRLHYHAYHDGLWGVDFTDRAFLERVRRVEACIAKIDAFGATYPKLDLLVVFGTGAQVNWYPDESARNAYDLDGKMRVMDKAQELWVAGYRCARGPDNAAEDGRMRVEGDCVWYNGHLFRNCLFLYPKYASKQVYGFLNEAIRHGVNLEIVGEAAIDFDADPAHVDKPVYREFDRAIVERMGVPKSAIKDGAVLADGSVVLMNRASIDSGKPAAFDIIADGVRYSGCYTGMLAFRYRRHKLEQAVSPAPFTLYADGERIDLPDYAGTEAARNG